MQHDDCDHDHHPFDAFFLIAFTSAPWIDLAAAGEGVELDDTLCPWKGNTMCLRRHTIRDAAVAALSASGGVSDV